MNATCARLQDATLGSELADLHRRVPIRELGTVPGHARGLETSERGRVVVAEQEIASAQARAVGSSALVREELAGEEDRGLGRIILIAVGPAGGRPVGRGVQNRIVAVASQNERGSELHLREVQARVRRMREGEGVSRLKE